MTTESLSYTSEQKKTLIALFLAAFLYITDTLLVGPHLPILTQAMGKPLNMGGYLVAIYFLCAALSAFLIAPFSDRIGYKKLILSGLILLGIADALMSQVTDFSYMLAIRGLAGIAAAMILPNVFAAVGYLFPYESRGKAISVVMAAIAAGSLVGIPLGTWITYQYEWERTYFVLSLYSLLPSLLILLLIPWQKSVNQVQHKEKKSYLLEFAETLKSTRIFPILICSFFFYVGLHGVLQFIGVFYSKIYGFNVSQIGFVYMIGSSGYLVGTNIGGRLADKYGKKVTFRAAALSTVVSLMIFSQVTENLLGVTLVIVGWCLSFGISEASLFAYISEIGKQNRGAVMSLNSLATYLAIASSSIMASSIIKISNFSLLVLICAIAVYVSFLIMKLKIN